MGLASIDPHSQKEHTEIHKIPEAIGVGTVPPGHHKPEQPTEERTR